MTLTQARSAKREESYALPLQDQGLQVSLPLLTLGFLGILAGQFSLGRIGLGEGWITDLRVWLIPLLLLGVAMRRTLLRKDPHLHVEDLHRIHGWLTAYGVFHAYLILSATWANEPNEVMGEALLLTVPFVLVWALATLAVENPTKAIDFILRLFYGAGVAYAAAGFLGIGADDPQGRMSALGGGPNVFVRIMVVAIVAAVFLFVKERRGPWLVPVPFFLVASILTGSRGGLLAALLAMLPLVLGVARVRTRGAARAALILSVVAALAAVAGILSQAVEYAESRVVTQTLQLRETAARDVLYRRALVNFAQDPLVGGGLRSSYSPLGTGDEATYPHNLVLQVAAEGGVIGLVLLSFTLWPLLLRTRTRGSREAAFTLFLARYFFFASLFSGGYYDNRYLWLFIALTLLASPRLSGISSGTRAREPVPEQPSTMSTRGDDSHVRNG